MTLLHDHGAALIREHSLRLCRVHGLRVSLGLGSICTCSHGAGLCSQPAKHAVARVFESAATMNRDTVMEWGERHPHENLGVVCGGASGLVVIEVQDEHRFRHLRQMLGGWPPSWTSRTPTGDVRSWFRTNSQAAQAKPDALGDGLTVLGAGSWAALPGSVEPGGEREQVGTHSWLVGPDAAPLAPLPRTWAEALAPAAPPRPRVQVFGLAVQR